MLLNILYNWEVAQMDEVTLGVGDPAPDFTLKDQNDQEVTLSALRGKKVVLSFHPLAWTRVCAIQMQDLEKHREDMERLGAVALGLSVDSVPCKKAWAESLGIQETRLLADFWPHGGVARAYGIFREKNGFSERAVFIVDAEGVIRFKKIYPMREVPDIGEILAALAEV
jgi:Peroxiredoxin